MWKRFTRLGAPIDESPVLGTAEIATDVLQSEVVLLGRVLGEARQEGDGVADVDAGDDVGVDQFAEKCTIGEANFSLESAMRGGTFGRTGRESLEKLGLTGGNRNAGVWVG